MKSKFLFLVAIFALLTIGCEKRQNPYVPESIENFKLVKKLEGDQARQFINRLHLKQVAPQENVIAFYKDQNKELILYLTYYQHENDAQKDWERMVNKISPENSVFVGGKVLQLEGRPVYRCFGMGQTHFVFVNHKVLVWLSTPTIGSEKWFKAYNDYLDCFWTDE